MHIQITNLHLNLTEADIQRLFAPYGEVNTIEILRDKLNNRSRGKAVVDMPVQKEALKAITSLHGFSFSGKAIGVVALPSTEPSDLRNFKY
jgi:RNA recognition motif-containing protein